MENLLFEYLLFLSKTLTILVAIVLILVSFGFILISIKNKPKEYLEVENINEQYDNYKDTLENCILSEDEYKKLQKQRKQEEKEHKKSKKHKKNQDEQAQHRLFVIRFHGDTSASEIDTLRETITAISIIATPQDEVLVILESGGGLVHSYGLAAAQLARLKARNIPLTIAVDLIAASGGYMMASVANKIIASPFAIIGSIGVLAQLPNFNKLLKRFDIDIEHHTAGEYKTTLTMLGKNTEKSREKFIEELEETHVLFKQFVSNNRPQIAIDKIATGEYWFGTKALELNLIDAISTSDDYLLEKSKSMDIYEVSYKITYSIQDRLSHFVQHSCNKIFTLIANAFSTNKLKLQ